MKSIRFLINGIRFKGNLHVCDRTIRSAALRFFIKLMLSSAKKRFFFSFFHWKKSFNFSSSFVSIRFENEGEKKTERKSQVDLFEMWFPSYIVNLRQKFVSFMLSVVTNIRAINSIWNRSPFTATKQIFVLFLSLLSLVRLFFVYCFRSFFSGHFCGVINECCGLWIQYLHAKWIITREQKRKHQSGKAVEWPTANPA